MKQTQMLEKIPEEILDESVFESIAIEVADYISAEQELDVLEASN